MKNLFLNFDVNGGFTISTSRNINALSCADNDIAAFLQDAKYSINTWVRFDIDFALRLLEDCYCWQNSNITKDTLELVYRLIKDYKDNSAEDRLYSEKPQ